MQRDYHVYGKQLYNTVLTTAIDTPGFELAGDT